MTQALQHDNEQANYSLNASAQSFTPQQWLPYPAAFGYAPVSQGEAAMYMPLPGMYYPSDALPSAGPPFFDPSMDSPFSNGALEGEAMDPSQSNMNPLAHSFRPTAASRLTPPSWSPTNGSTSSEPHTPSESPLSSSPNTNKRDCDGLSYASMAAKAVKSNVVPKTSPDIGGQQKRKRGDKQAKRTVLHTVVTDPSKSSRTSTEGSQRGPDVQTGTVAVEFDDGWQIAGKRRVSPSYRAHTGETALPPRLEDALTVANLDAAPEEGLEGSRRPGSPSIFTEHTQSNGPLPADNTALHPESAQVDDFGLPEVQNHAAAPTQGEQQVRSAEEDLMDAPEPDRRTTMHDSPPLYSAEDKVVAELPGEDSPTVNGADQEPMDDPEPTPMPSIIEESSEEVRDHHQVSLDQSIDAEGSTSSIQTSEASAVCSDVSLADASGSTDPFGPSSRKSVLSQSTSSIPRSSVHGNLSRYAIDEEGGDDDDEQQPDEEDPSDPRRHRDADEPPSLTLSIFSQSGRPWRHRMFAILGSLGINIFLPFVNGVMLGFGEIFAREFIADWLGLNRITPSLRVPRQQTASTANVGLSSTRRTHDVPGHAGAKTISEGVLDVIREGTH